MGVDSGHEVTMMTSLAFVSDSRDSHGTAAKNWLLLMLLAAGCRFDGSDAPI